jgi:hypothetical protein
MTAGATDHDAPRRQPIDREPVRVRLWDAFGQNPPLEIYQVADELR